MTNSLNKYVDEFAEKQKKKFPKITIITPSYNQDAYLEQTILSILNQKYPNLEYIIIDGGSTDNSKEIIEKYATQLAYWVSEPDNGLYHALQKGFSLATGDIMAWLNSDDMLHPFSLSIIADVFTKYPQIEWLTGRASFFNEKNQCIGINNEIYLAVSKKRFLIREPLFIQQESTFWRKCIWEKAGGYISTDYKFASDYELWSRFIQLAPLYGIAALIGGFRLRTNNLSLINIEEYLKEMVYIRSKMLISTSERLMIFILLILNLFVFRYFDKIGLIRRFKRYCFNLPPDIFFNRHNQEFEIKE